MIIFIYHVHYNCFVGNENSNSCYISNIYRGKVRLPKDKQKQKSTKIKELVRDIQ